MVYKINQIQNTLHLFSEHILYFGLLTKKAMAIKHLLILYHSKYEIYDFRVLGLAA
jgi:hypothetical protein